MFITKNKGKYHWFNQNSLDCKLNFELIGILLGLAIYNGINLNILFPTIVYKKLMEEEVGLDDVKEIDPDVYSNL